MGNGLYRSTHTTGIVRVVALQYIVAEGYIPDRACEGAEMIETVDKRIGAGAWQATVRWLQAINATPGGALIANGLGALAVALTAPTIMIRVYSMAKASGCPLRYAIATEGGWDIGCASGCLAAAAMLWAGMDFTAPILMSLVGVVLAGGLLVSTHRAVRT